MKTLNQKRLAKVIALGLVVGGFSFANVDNVYAAEIGDGTKVVAKEGNIIGGQKTQYVNVASQKDLVDVNTQVNNNTDRITELEKNKVDTEQIKADVKADVQDSIKENVDKVVTDKVGNIQDKVNSAVDNKVSGIENTANEAKKTADAAKKAVDGKVDKVTQGIKDKVQDIKIDTAQKTANGALALAGHADKVAHEALDQANKNKQDIADKADKSDINDLKVEDAKQNTAIHDLQFANGQQDMAIEDAQNAADKANDRLNTLEPQVDKNTSDISKLENDKLGKEEFNSYTDKQDALDKEQSDKIADLDQTKANKSDVNKIHDEVHYVNDKVNDLSDKQNVFEQYQKAENNKLHNADERIEGKADSALEQANQNKTDISGLKDQVGTTEDKVNAAGGNLHYAKGDNLSTNVGELDKALADEATTRFDEDQKLNNKIDTETDNRVAEDAKLDGKINTETTNRENADRVLQDNINSMDTKFSGEVSRLDSRIDKVDDKINKVGAMAAAIANLHTMGYDPEAPTEFAMSVGQYRDETGMAIGLFHYPNRDFMLSLSVSRAGEEYMGGIGATWKFGRKSPEKMLAEQKEKAAKEKLAKAEAMKEAARQARVEAQMARHAKMLAEREAAAK